MANERDVSEQERLDRIERHIKQLADASAALQVELQIARQLAAERAAAVETLNSPRLKRRRIKTRRSQR